MDTTLTPKILQALQVPFPGEHIEWKPQATTKDKRRALAAAYVDPRRYQERLDAVVPGRWQTHVEIGGPQGAVVKVSLTLCGVTRENVGEADPADDNTVTSAFAQAFKRCCADFGLGRYLYFLPQRWCDYDQQKRRITAPPALPAWALPKTPPKGNRNGNGRSPARKNGRRSGTGNGRVKAAPDPDSPPGAYVIGWGKNQGQRLDQLEPRWVAWYARELKPTTPERQQTQAMAQAYLASLTPEPA